MSYDSRYYGYPPSRSNTSLPPNLDGLRGLYNRQNGYTTVPNITSDTTRHTSDVPTNTTYRVYTQQRNEYPGESIRSSHLQRTQHRTVPIITSDTTRHTSDVPTNTTYRVYTQQQNEYPEESIRSSYLSRTQQPRQAGNHSSSKTSAPKIPSVYTFGVEIEAVLRPRSPALESLTNLGYYSEGSDASYVIRECLALALKNNGIPAKANPSSDSLGDYSTTWNISYDCSLPTEAKIKGYFGVEIISRILYTTEDWRAAIRKAWKVITHYFDVFPHKRCGTHIHFSTIGGFSLSEVKWITKAVCWYGPAITAMLPSKRREECRSMAASNTRSSKANSTLRKLCKSKRWGAVFKRIDSFNSINDLISWMCPDRYFAFNYHNLNKQSRTIEWRQPPSICELNTLLDWISFGVSFIHYSRSYMTNVRVRDDYSPPSLAELLQDMRDVPQDNILKDFRLRSEAIFDLKIADSKGQSELKAAIKAGIEQWRALNAAAQKVQPTYDQSNVTSNEISTDKSPWVYSTAYPGYMEWYDADQGAILYGYLNGNGILEQTYTPTPSYNQYLSQPSTQSYDPLSR